MFNMIFKIIFKFFVFAAVLFSVSLYTIADTVANSLSQINIEKPFDNSYQLNLLFKDDFKGNAFLQKRQNGSFYVYIPDTVMTTKNIKIVYKGNVKRADVKINIDEQPYIKENSKSKYVRLSVDTPVNSEIQLTSQKFIPQDTKSSGAFANLYSIILTALLSVIFILSVGIHRTIKKMNNNSGAHTTFPARFLNSPDDYMQESTEKEYNKFTSKPNNSKKFISPVSTKEFSCFNLPLKQGEISMPISSAISNESNADSLENKTVISKTTNPLSRRKTVIKEMVSPIDMPLAEDLTVSSDSEKTNETESKTEENYRPELISELKIGSNKGFYLTTVGNNAFALFGYIGEKVFFLQKFNDLTQINLQARFYANKNGRDLYVVRLDSYKAMLMVSDTEIKELAVI